MESTHQFRMICCEVGERTVGEGDHRTTVGVAVGSNRLDVGDDGVKPEPIEIGNERFQGGRRGAICTGTNGTLVPADGFGIGSAGVQT